MARSRVQRFSRGPRRTSGWFGGPSSGTDGSSQSIGSNSVVIMTTGAATATDGLTLVRTRGELSLQISTASAIGDGFFGAFGLCIVSVQAFAVGATAVPGPVGEENWDGWFYHSYFNVYANAANVTGDHAQVVTTVDSKAMRKLQDNEVIIGVIEALEVGGSTLLVHFNCRILVKLA